MQNQLEKLQFFLSNLKNINSDQETDQILNNLVNNSLQI